MVLPRFRKGDIVKIGDEHFEVKSSNSDISKLRPVAVSGYGRHTTYKRFGRSTKMETKRLENRATPEHTPRPH